ncbi:hypothetical protein L207DRAFT_252068 [Hyaloscypha variabilis F]|uniref:Uncharacterized protein n=1 Tax=Hyaloscypha variabilis (strain UAMH 11265 / GT02V1 / F) TaxID=1149755 RepID=A0A2J6S3H5_HYAVF|nr:hypothetical protein L207DRAFT_252068 [Hyaloscypha variabilis F]
MISILRFSKAILASPSAKRSLASTKSPIAFPTPPDPYAFLNNRPCASTQRCDYRVPITPLCFFGLVGVILELSSKPGSAYNAAVVGRHRVYFK